MKSPTNYGSENEEARFIRRVAAPDRPNNKRRQKKRLAIAGATLGLLAVSAGVGYVTMKNAGASTAVKTAEMEASLANEQFVSKLGDAFHPDFDKIDQDGDGELTKKEILADLTEKEEADVDKVKNSDLPEDMKKNVLSLLEEKLQSDVDCATQASDERRVPVSRANHKIFFYLLDVFCPRVTIAVTPPDQEEEVVTGENQQTVEIPTPSGGTMEVVIVGEPVDGQQTIAIPDGDGGYATTEVRSFESPTGEQKILIPNSEGDITPVVVPKVPEEVATDMTGDTQVVDVVMPSGETEQVIIVGEPEHGEQTVKIPDSKGGYIETQAKVEETVTGEETIVVETADGNIIDVPVPEPIEPIEEHMPGENGGYYGEEPEPVQQTVEMTTSTGETQQVTLIGEVENGKQTVEITNEQGETTTTEVKAVETASGDVKLAIPDGEGGVIPVVVPEVPEEVTKEAEQTGEQVQVVAVETPTGETEQVVIVGEPEHGKVTVEIVDEHGEVTTTEAKVEETATGEQQIMVETSEGDIIAVPVPEVIEQKTETATAVQQTVEMTTSTGETQQVTLIGEVENGKQTVEITNEQGETTTTEVKAVETASGDVKLAIPDGEGGVIPVVVPEVPEEVTKEAEQTGEQVQVVAVETPTGETEQVVIVGEPEHGKVTVEIVDEHGEVTTTEAKVEETATGEQQIMVETSEGDIIAVPVPEVIEQKTETATAVQQTVEMTTSTGETQQVTLIGEVENGKQTVEITNEQGETTTTEVKAVETASGDVELAIPDGEGGVIPVVVPEVPEEVTKEAEQTGEQVQVVAVETPTGETEQVVIVGEPEHGKVTVEIVDEHGEVTTTEAKVEETATGEQQIMVETSEGDIIAVPVPEVIEQKTETATAVQQTVEMTTSTGETQQVTLIGEVENGKQTVEITNEQGETTTTEVKAVETASGDVKLAIPDGEGGVIPVVVPEVPEEVTKEAEQTGEQVQVVAVETPTGETEQVVIVGEPEHGKVTVEIVDEHGEVTTTEAKVEETATGEQQIMVKTSEGDIIAVPVPEVIEQKTETATAVQQTVEMTTSTGETQQVTLIGEVENGKQTVEITNEQGETTTTEVKAVETASGDVKLAIPDGEGGVIPVVVPEVPEEVTKEAEQTGEQVQVVAVETPTGETEQVVIVGEPEHGKVTVEIVDEHGEVTTTEAKVEETATGEQQIMVKTSEGDIIAVPVPEVIEQKTETATAVQQTVEMTTSTGETQQVTLIGEVENGKQTVEITNEQGETTTTEVKAVETASGDVKLAIPDGEGGVIPVVVPEVPEEVTKEAEQTGEQVQVVAVETPTGETEQVVIVGEPEHGKVTVEIVDEHGEVTTTEAKVEETATGEQQIMVETSEGDIIAVPVPEVIEQKTETATAVQQTVEMTTSTGETQQVTLIGEVENGKQTVEITNEQGETTTTEVKAVETASGDVKLAIPDGEGGVIPVVVPEVPEEVTKEAEQTGEQVQVVAVETPTGETEQVVIVGEPEHGKVTVEIVDEHGEVTTTEAKVEETATGEQQIMVETSEGDIIAVPVPEVIEQKTETATAVQQTVEMTTSTGETQQVTLIGEVENGKQTVEITNEQGETTTTEVKAVETASGDVKLAIPDGEGGVIPVVVPEVPEEVTKEAEQTGEQVQVVAVETPTGETEQVVIVGEPEHGKVTVEIVDEHGEVTTTEAKVEETATGEQQIMVETSEGDIIAVPVPEVIEQKTETATAVQQTVEMTTSTGETQQVTLIGEVENGKQTVEITNEQGETTTTEVKAVETASGDVKLAIPDGEGGVIPVVVPEVPEEVTKEAEQTGEQVQVVAVETPTGETEQVVIVGEPEHGKVTVEIVDEHGEVTTTEAKVEETATGEQQIMVETSEGDIIAVPVPEVIEQKTETATAVQQTVEMTTSTGETQQVTLIGEVENGKQTVEITNEQGETTTTEVKAVETASGDVKLAIPDGEGGVIPVVVPEVPEEVTKEAEQTGEQVQVVAVETPTGETEQVVIVGEPEHGKVTVEIVDEHGEVTTTEAKVEETATGEQQIMVETSEGDIIAVPVPEVIEQKTETATAVQQTVEMTTSTGETQQVTLIGEVENGKQTVEITNEQGETTTTEVKAVETASGDVKLAIPDGEGGVIPVVVPEVPEEVTKEAEQTGEQVQVVAVETPTGETEQVVIVGEPEHGKVTVEIVDEHGEVTTTEAKVEETATGEQQIMVETSEGDIIAVPVPEVIEQKTETATAVQQTVEMTTSTGETQQVTLIGEVENGKQTVEITNEQGETTTTEVKAVETASGDVKLAIPDGEGGVIPVVVPEVPEEVTKEAEQTGEQVQVVAVETPTGETEQVVIVGEPEHGKVTVEIVDEHGEVTTTEAKVEETATGEQQIMVETSEGDIIAVPVPEVIEQKTETATAVQQTVEMTTSTGETQQVTLIGEVENGKQTVEITNEQGETTTTEVKAVETASGDVKLAIPDGEGGVIPVVVPEVPEEVTKEAEQTGEQVQVVAVETPTGETEQVVIVGEPEHGKVTVEIVDEHGEVTTTEAKVEETATGEQQIMVETSEGDIIAVPVPEVIEQKTETATAVQQTVEMTTSTGETQQVTLIGEVENGKQTVEITNEQGETTTTEVKAVETASGDVKLAIPDGEGGVIPVVVPEVPEEVTKEAEQTGEQVQVVAVETPTGETEQVVIVGEPEHGKVTVEIVDEHGEVTTTEAKVEETATGEQQIMVETSEGDIIAVPVPVVLMTKEEFHDKIAQHYQNELAVLKQMEQKLEEEVRAKSGRVQGLQDCIEQAANKFGYYGVYEQAPHFQNAVDWVQNDCWVADRWEPESPPAHRMLRR